MPVKFAAGIAAFALCLGTAFAQEFINEDVPATVDELLEAIGETLEAYDVPAVGFALVDESGPVWVGSLGKANIEDDVDADADTVYRIGSTSKMFVALAVLQLVEEGRLSLDDKLADLAPEVEFENPWEETNPIRIVHLLEHTTGWDDIHLPEYAHNDPTPATLIEGIDFHPHSRKSRWQPGTRSSYCNAGPPIAAYIVQKITGQDFEEYVQQNFFGPLDMTGATYRLDEGYQQKAATLYQGDQPLDYWHILMRPSGAINASPNDMARFLEMYINRGTVDGVQYVSEESLARMERVESTSGAKAGQEAGYGLHNYSSTHEHWVYRAHNGGVAGGLTEFAYLPDAKVGYAFMINSGSGAAYGEISDLVRNFQTRELPVPEIPEAGEPTDADREIAGLYFPINSRQQIGHFLDRTLGVEKYWFEDGLLMRKAVLDDDVREYVPAGDGLYRSPETGMIVLSSTTDPIAGPVIHAGGMVLQPVSGLVAYGKLVVVALWVVSILTSFLYFLVWGVRKLRGKVPAGPSTRIRLWPLLASASAVAFVALFASGMTDMETIFTVLGVPTATSISIMLATIAFAVFALLGLYTAVTERETQMNRANYWYSAATSFVHVLVVIYLVRFGIIGIQTWA